MSRKRLLKIASAVKANHRKMKIITSDPPKPIGKISKPEAIKLLRKFRDAWETMTLRNEDLPDERLENEGVSEPKKHLKWYYSDEARAIAARYLIDMLAYM